MDIVASVALLSLSLFVLVALFSDSKESPTYEEMGFSREVREAILSGKYPNLCPKTRNR